jgi:hypothetical protein
MNRAAAGTPIPHTSELEVAAIICSHPFVQQFGDRAFTFHDYVLDVLNTTVWLEIEALRRENASIRRRLRRLQNPRDGRDAAAH